MAADQTQIGEEEKLETSDSEPTSPDTQQSGQADVLMSLESLIKNNIASIDKLTDELREHRAMFTDSFANDPVFKELEEKAKEATKAKSSTKQQLSSQPSVRQLADKVKTISSELKEKKLSLSDYLLEYQRMSGVNEIEGHDGEVREIVNAARVVKKTSKS